MSDELPVQRASAGLVDRAKNILMTPQSEWAAVASETKSPTEVLMQYALPLMAIGPICTILGSFLITNGLGLTYYVVTAVVSFVLGICSLYALSFIANFLSPKFGGKDDFAAAFRLVAYSQTPGWVLGVLGLLTGVAPAIGFLGILALYGLYLFYLGATPVMSVPQDKSVGYTVVTIVGAIVLYIIVGAITAAILATMVVSAMQPALVVYQ